MAALGQIRRKGALLVTVIALALFAFIAEELVRSCESTKNERNQQIGEVLGKRVNATDYQKLVDQYTDAMKFTQNRDNFTEQELNQIKDNVWNTLVQNAIIADEAEKIGLTVTDAELQGILAAGTNRMLLQTPFVNQQTGRFDAETLKKFLAEYKQAQSTNPQLAEQYQSLYNYWTFVETNLRTQVLAQKYQVLLGSCFLSNPVSAKAAFKEAKEENSILLATVPYSSVGDDVDVSEAEVKAKYEELKPLFVNIDETRDIKYVAVKVTASAADRQALDKEMAAAREELATTDDPATVVRKATSLVTYLGVPQTKSAFPRDIASLLDSITPGTITAVSENKRDNTLNVVRLIGKQQLPDSIEYRVIYCMQATVDESRALADSVFTALQQGADFEGLAQAHNQKGEKQWMTSAMYQTQGSLDKDSRTIIETLNTLPVGQMKNVELSAGNAVLVVTQRSNLVDKYTAAVIKRSIDFSKDTYSAAYNKFSQFVSENLTASDMEKGAEKYGYKVLERKELGNTAHYVGNITGTRDALKWVFDAKPGEVSPLYECGDNDQLLVVMLTGVNKKGYLTLDNAGVREYCTTQALNDKKAAKIGAEIEGVKSVADVQAKYKDAKIDTLQQVTFAAPVFVRAAGASEPALSGAVAATDKGQLSAPVKGNGGVYVFVVLDKQAADDEGYVEAEYSQQVEQKAMQRAGNFMRDLYQNAKVTDNRYLFF